MKANYLNGALRSDGDVSCSLLVSFPFLREKGECPLKKSAVSVVSALALLTAVVSGNCGVGLKIIRKAEPTRRVEIGRWCMGVLFFN